MGALLLVRHGRASWDAEDYDVLSETGWAQGRTLGRSWAAGGVRPTAVVRGSLRRHRETTEAVLDGLGVPDLSVEVDPGWNEFDHLDLLARMPGRPAVEPTDPTERQHVLERAVEAWIVAGSDHPYAESYVAFTARALAAFERAHGLPGTVAVVTSGGVIAAVAAHLLAAGEAGLAATVWPRLNVVGVNTGVSRVILGRRGATLVSFNEHAHLDGAPELLTYR